MIFTYFKSLGNKKLALVVSLTAAVIMLSFAMYLGVGDGSMSVLYSGMEPAEKNEITHFLDKWGKVYSTEGDDVLVVGSEVREIRMLLAAEGLPSTGSMVGYEIFNKSESFGTSGFVQNVNLIRALEGELGRTIMSFDKVRKARVHLVIPKKEVFARSKPQTTASVVLTLNGNTNSFLKKEIDAIAYLISSSVPDLSVSNVTIVTTNGASLRLPGEDGLLSLSMQEYKFDVEHRIRDSVEALVEKTIGLGKVRAEVTAEVDFDQLVVDSELYDPDGQVVRSNQTMEEHDKHKEGSEVNTSVSNNVSSGGDASEGESASYRSKEKVEVITNYEISKERRKQVKSVGDIKRLSVAVLVDGNYDFDQESGESTYNPLDEATIGSLKKLIASAVGLQKSRGDVLDVVNMRFYPEIVEEIKDSWLSNYMYELIRLGVLSIIILVIAFCIVRPLINKLLDRLYPVQPCDVGEDQVEQAGTEAEAEEEPPELSGIEALNSFASSNPDVAVEMIRAWISDPKGK